jgi:gliding motility-associated protein GldM
VLTAMLALNVSAEILNAFKTVDSSLVSTNETVHHSTDAILTSLQEKKSDPTLGAKAQIWYDKAQQAKQESDLVYNYIQTLRMRIMKEAGFDPIKNHDSSYKADNLDIATRIMVEQGEGKKLYDMLSNYKRNILGIDNAINNEFKNSLQIDLRAPRVQDKSNKKWEDAYFHMVPTVAAMTILSKFQNDVRTSENKVIAYCHEQVGKVEFKFDNFEAIVGQNSKYFMPGQEIEINAGLGAFSKNKVPDISVGGAKVTIGDKGYATYKTSVGAIGQHTIPVTVSFIDQDGKQQTRTINVEYTVGQANASIALDKMNVLYIGVDNPITIAASGGGDDKVQASISSGSLTKVGPGKYVAKVNTISDDCRITVSVEGKVAGVSQFRVRTIPDAVATVGGYPSGDNVPAGALRAQTGVGAYIKDFPFELKYSVTSFSISADNDEGDIETADCQGNTWNAKAQQILKNIKPGRTLTVDAIYAVGPDGRRMTLTVTCILYTLN